MWTHREEGTLKRNACNEIYSDNSLKIIYKAGYVKVLEGYWLVTIIIINIIDSKVVFVWNISQENTGVAHQKAWFINYYQYTKITASECLENLEEMFLR